MDADTFGIMCGWWRPQFLDGSHKATHSSVTDMPGLQIMYKEGAWSLLEFAIKKDPS